MPTHSYYNCTYIFAFSNIKGMGIKFIMVTLLKAIYLQENVIEIKVSKLLDDDKVK